MKRILLFFFMGVGVASFAQTAVEKTFTVQGATELILEADDPQILLQTWDKNEVLVKASVTINMGDNDNAFEIKGAVEGTALKVSAMINGKSELPHRVSIRKGEQTYYFKARNFNDPEVQKFMEQNGREYSSITSGVLVDITVEIFVPKNFKTTVIAKYGLVEFKKFEAPLQIDAKYGKVDATITAMSTGQLTARTKFGEILTNLDIKFDQLPFDIRTRDKWNEITAHPGKGYDYTLESKYGNVYLRKP